MLTNQQTKNVIEYNQPYIIGEMYTLQSINLVGQSDLGW
jgi:hypothetical protein